MNEAKGERPTDMAWRPRQAWGLDLLREKKVWLGQSSSSDSSYPETRFGSDASCSSV